MAIISSKPADLESAKLRKEADAGPKTEKRVPKSVIVACKTDADQQEDNVRPHRLAGYIGQQALVQNLTLAIAAAKDLAQPLDHILLYGPSGLGKTTMSLILAAEMGTTCKVTSAPALERPRDIVGLLMSLQNGEILFIDEIHRLNKVTQEFLYTAMEDRKVDITAGKGQSARVRSLPIKPFTLVGATTNLGNLTAPMRNRFGITQRLEFYEPEQLAQIIEQSARIINVKIDHAAALVIGMRSRGTPRIANRLLRRVRDYAIINHRGCSVDETIAIAACDFQGVDNLGLDSTDYRILNTIINSFDGGPVGLETIAAATGEDATTIEGVVEPYLMSVGFLQRTRQGRSVTDAARAHINSGA